LDYRLENISTWYIKENDISYGPFTWHNILEKVKNHEVTNSALLKEELWPDWVPINYYFSSEGLITQITKREILSMFKLILFYILISFLILIPLWIFYFQDWGGRSGARSPIGPIYNYISFLIF
jgi:hypothetical protein